MKKNNNERIKVKYFSQKKNNEPIKLKCCSKKKMLQPNEDRLEFFQWLGAQSLERLMSPGIMGEQLKALLKPPTSRQYGIDGFKGYSQFDSEKREQNISSRDIFSSFMCLFYFSLFRFIFFWPHTTIFLL